MRLGSRFSVGDSPRGVPDDFLAALRAAESELSEEEATTLRWTLTWLENRPRATLDNGVSVKG